MYTFTTTWVPNTNNLPVDMDKRLEKLRIKNLIKFNILQLKVK